jgi:protein-S-isoprenylcysteine O-methyltransferase Ste14
MQRLLVGSYALAVYALFLATILLLMGFLLGFGPAIIDAGPAAPLPVAIPVNLGLIALFGVQHGVMARQRFKDWLTRAIPPAAERSTFVLAASLLLIVLAFAWRPLPQPIWIAEAPWVRVVVTGLAIAGWIVLIGSTFVLDHFAQFGLRPAILPPRAESDAFRTPLVYRYVRHPQYLGFLLLFWATPSLTLGRLLFNAGMTAYIFIGASYEERDLIARFGDAYREYRSRVRMLFPLP